MLTASDHSAQKGRGQRSSRFTAEQICSAIRDLRQVVNPDVRVQMLLRVVVHHGLDDPEVVALAMGEVEHACCSPGVRRMTLAKLQPQQTPLWHVVPNSSVESPSFYPLFTHEIRLDPELGRLAIGLHRAAQLRLWALGRHLSTQRHAGRGWLEIEAFWSQLRALGIAYTRRHFRRLLQAGAGTFWTCSPRRIYFIGVQKVAAQLAAASIGQEALIRTNRPGGMKDVYLPVAGSLERWESLIYAGWLAAKENPIIARETLASLFGRTAKTIRQWERDRLQQIVSIRPCYAQLADPQANAALIPEHSYAYVAGVREPSGWQIKHEIRIRWRLPNCYQSTIRQHNRRGQSRKVRNLTNAVLDLQPPEETAGGWPSKNPRRYFEHARQLRRLARKYGAGQGRRYLFLGRDRCDHNLFEPNQDGYPMTHANERVGSKLERWFLG